MNTGAIGVKREIFGSILEQRMKVHKDGWNVATFQCRDISASYSSQSLKAKVGPEFKGGSEIEEV